MKKWKSILAGVGVLVAAAATIGAAPPDDDNPSYTPATSPYDVTVTDRGYTVQLTAEAAAEAGLTAEEALDAVCEGTYFFQRVSNTIEWGSQNTCSPTLPAEYAPQRIDVTLEGTCNEAWCIAWYTEDGPINSGWTYSRVATATTTETCDSNDLRRFRIAVHLRYAGGALDYGTVRSAPWYDVDCDV